MRTEKWHIDYVGALPSGLSPFFAAFTSAVNRWGLASTATLFAKQSSLVRGKLVGAIVLCILTCFRLLADSKSDQDSVINFRVSGSITQMWSLIASNSISKAGLPATNSEMTFSFERVGENWHLEAKDFSRLLQGRPRIDKDRAPDGRALGRAPAGAIPLERLLVAGCDGDDVFSFVKMVPLGENSGDPIFQGSVTPGPKPLVEQRVRGIVFAFGVQHGNGQSWEMPAPWPSVSNSTIYAQITSFADLPHLPEKATFFNASDMRNPVGFYSCNRSTNFNGLRIPTEFTIAHLALSSNDRITNSEWHFIVDGVALSKLTRFVPAIDRSMIIVDYRFADTNHGLNDEVIYTNSQWLSVDDPFLQGFVKKPRVARANLNPAQKGANINLVRGILLVVAIFPIVFLLARRFKAETNKQNK